MRSALVITCCLLVIGGCSGKATSENNDSRWYFHTKPDKWKEARVFHRAFDKEWSERVVFTRIPIKTIGAEKVYSPNKAYWFSVTGADCMTQAQCDAEVTIFNERDYLLQFKISEMKYYPPKTAWINEKLLHVRVWLGIRLGLDQTIDVEKEEIIYQEMIHSGTIAFQQWQQSRQNK
jgi:hypothetical protein